MLNLLSFVETEWTLQKLKQSETNKILICRCMPFDMKITNPNTNVRQKGRLHKLDRS